MRVTAVQDSLVLPYIGLHDIGPHGQKYKSITKYQGFRHLAFVLCRRVRYESTNQLRSFNGSGIWLLYFVDAAVMKVQINYVVSMGPAVAVCTLAITELLFWTNTSANAPPTPSSQERQLYRLYHRFFHSPNPAPYIIIMHYEGRFSHIRMQSQSIRIGSHGADVPRARMGGRR